MPLTHVPVQQQQSAASDQFTSSSHAVQPQPLPARPLPIAVWEEHLLPMLMCKNAARLGCTCKALRAVVREHSAGDLGRVKLKTLQAVLTTFPRAQSMRLEDFEDACGEEQREALFPWLREGGRGRYLKGITAGLLGRDAQGFVHKALQQGALPSLQHIDVSLRCEIHRASLTNNLLRSLCELRMVFTYTENQEDTFPQLEALGLVRQLPALVRLEICVDGYADYSVRWPPFIPPSLRALHIEECQSESPCRRDSLLLCAFPGMLEASGARLDRLEVLIPADFESMGDGLVHLTQALRHCSPTLKGFLLSTDSGGPVVVYGRDEDDDRDQKERLRMQWADVLAGVSACRELHVLVFPEIILEPLFPPGTAFSRLTHLEICDHERVHPPDAGVMGLWELVASGGLPALAKLSLNLEGCWVSLEDVRTRVTPAFEAVAGTLTHLHLQGLSDPDGNVRGDEADVGYELGVAMGKLRRLKDLGLDLFRDGRAYHAMAQGLASSPPPCSGKWKCSHVSVPIPTSWGACFSRAYGSSARSTSTPAWPS
jgi:hypothetical protein